MAKKETSIDSNINMDNIMSDFHASDEYVSTKRSEWDDKERIWHAKLSDDITTDETKSQIHDPRLSTWILERSERTVGNLPKGRPMPLSKSDRGKNKLMSMVLEKYVYPNANSQFDFKTKLKMMDAYSQVYGSYFALTDWVVDKRKNYIGPDLFLVPIRDIFPQVGAVSLNDSDHIMVSTFQTLEYLKTRDPESWNGLKKFFDHLEEMESIPGTGPRSSKSADRQSTRYAYYYNNDGPGKKNPVFELVSRYERDKWVIFTPAYPDHPLKVIENPHNDGELPIVGKYCIPLIDDFFGLGEIERSETLQKSLDSLINLYFDGVKMSLFPPIQINTDGVTPSTIKMRPGTKWFVDRPNVDVQVTNVSPRGLETFTSSYQYLLAALQNSQGTSDTAVPSHVDRTLGRTPQALKMQDARQNTRDVANKYQMEVAVTKVLEKFVNLISNKMSTTLVLTMFKDEVEDIVKDYPDLIEITESGEGVRFKINPSDIKAKYKFEIEPGSMTMRDPQAESDALTKLLKLFVDGAQIDPSTQKLTSPMLEAMKKSGYEFNVGETLRQIAMRTGIEDIDKIVVDAKEKQKLEGEMQSLLNQMSRDVQPQQGGMPNAQNQTQQGPNGFPGSQPIQ